MALRPWVSTRNGDEPRSGLEPVGVGRVVAPRAPNIGMPSGVEVMLPG